MHSMSNMFKAKMIFTTCLIFSLISNVYPATVTIQKCANRCAKKCCGMSEDTKVFYCLPNGDDDHSGKIDFELSDEDKMKLPDCFKLITDGSTNPYDSPKFQELENKKMFDECLRACKIELVNWCIRL